MLKAVFILSLAMVAMADKVATTDQVIRIGSLGTTYTHVKGVLVPSTPTLAKGNYPAYEFKTTLDGVPIVETDKIYFRCTMLSDFHVPHVDNPKPVYLCRNDAFEKSTVRDSGAEKMAFLFCAEELTLPAGANDLELVVGRGMWKTLIASHAAAFSKPEFVRALYKEELYDGYKVLTSISPYETLLTYDTPTTRVKRQFDSILNSPGVQATNPPVFGSGLPGAGIDPILAHDIPKMRVRRQFGFGGSGAQASASSFGGGGGFGGFPGGGFGGGFSGSHASAGAGSFGSGGFFG